MSAISRIAIYPIKSLDPHLLNETALVGPGALRHDRAFAFFDSQDRWLRAKTRPALQRLRASYTVPAAGPDLRVTLTPPAGAAASFTLPGELAAMGRWMGAYLGEEVTAKHAPDRGFPDEMDLYWGPTIIATATLEAVRAWFPELTLEEVRRRFRANLEVSEVPAWWEDGLLGDGPEAPALRVGPVLCSGFHPCARCAVPTRDSRNGEADNRFQARFMERRRAELPAWADARHFANAYRLALCTRTVVWQPGDRISLGDSVTVIAP